jgi:branched-chain amino acid transport system permease protein
VDLNVMQGSVHGLIGPNGSGKSTMMNVLTGIYKPTAGKVAFAGAVISGRTPSEIALGGVAHLPERAAVRRNDGHRERAGRPAQHLQIECAGRDAANAALQAEESRARAAASILEFVGLSAWPTRRRAISRMASSACWKSAARWA